MKKQIIKKLEKIAEKHGADELAAVIDGIYCNGQVTTQGDPPLTCPAGYVYSESLKKCIPDIG